MDIQQVNIYVAMSVHSLYLDVKMWIMFERIILPIIMNCGFVYKCNPQYLILSFVPSRILQGFKFNLTASCRITEMSS